MIIYENGEETEAQDSVEVGGFKELIPHGTTLLCRVLGVMWKEGKEYQNGDKADDTLNIDLEVIEDGKYKNRIETHKLKAWASGAIYGGGTDEVKAEKDRKKAIDFLIVYDTIAGGKIRKHKKQWHEIIDEMTDMLADTKVQIKFGCTDAMASFNPDTDRANQYIQAVSRPPAAAVKAAAMPPTPTRKPKAPTKVHHVDADFDDDIPF